MMVVRLHADVVVTCFSNYAYLRSHFSFCTLFAVVAMMPARIGIFQKWMGPTAAFGLINPIDDSQDVFVLRSSDGAESLVRGDRVRRASLRARGLQEVRIGFWS